MKTTFRIPIMPFANPTALDGEDSYKDVMAIVKQFAQVRNANGKETRVAQLDYYASQKTLEANRAPLQVTERYRNLQWEAKNVEMSEAIIAEEIAAQMEKPADAKEGGKGFGLVGVAINK